MNLIYKGILLQYITNDEETTGEIIRVIWIDKDYKYASFVSMSLQKCIPKIVSIEELQNNIMCGNMREIEDFFIKTVPEDIIPSKYIKIRDRNWEAVQSLWEGEEPLILLKNKRKNCIKEVAKKFNISESTVERVITRFWQRGMNKNALIPDYSNSGAKGRKRRAGTKKRGRPRIYGSDSKLGESIGINVTDEIEKIMLLSINMFYRKKGKPSLKETYNWMLQKFFADVAFQNGKEKRIIWESNRIPSYTQLYNFYQELRKSDKKQDIISRLGEKEFQSKYRELLGNSTVETFGPGSKYQIDATIADVYLVSTVNRNKIIGRPVVYAVIDVYSRLITGIYTGLEGPSWIGAMMALKNVAINKVEFCKLYGIEINQEEWPCEYLPEAIIADRGEFESYQVENLINNLNIKVENTPPYRGDLKGIVERQFRTINEKIKHVAPGAIQKEFRQRGDRDYRLDAILDLKEFTQIIINLILLHNKSQVEKYPRERGMIADEVAPIPIDIWNWGIKNRKNRFVKKSEDILILNLLPKGVATVSREGIVLKKIYYSSEKAVEEQWFIKGNGRKVDIVYDPRNMDYIYIPLEKGNGYIKCNLLEKSVANIGLFYEEIIFQQELESELKYELSNKMNQITADHSRNISDIIASAKNKKGETIGISNNKKIKSIRENRAIEKELMREEEKVELGEKQENTCQVISTLKDDNSIEQPKLNMLGMLKRKRDEKHEK